jgi:very-short-patch-repair endonuclease
MSYCVFNWFSVNISIIYLICQVQPSYPTYPLDVLGIEARMPPYPNALLIGELSVGLRGTLNLPMKFEHNDPLFKFRRKELRNNSTREEWILWLYLKNQQLGVKFRRQFGIGHYIADFYCHEKKLIIELDGSQHYYEDGVEYDKVRDDFLTKSGFHILRFTNKEVNESMDGIIMKIKEVIQAE